MPTENTLLTTLATSCGNLAAEASAAIQEGLASQGTDPALVDRMEAAIGILLASVEGLVNVSGGLTVQGINRALDQHRARVLPAGLAAKDDYWKLCLAPADRPRHG